MCDLKTLNVSSGKHQQDRKNNFFKLDKKKFSQKKVRMKIKLLFPSLLDLLRFQHQLKKINKKRTIPSPN